MPKRVLIVDDSPSIRKMVFILFTSNGFSVCGEAENGAQAIEKARETRPDIIVLDYRMPVMDGIRAAKSLKQLMPRVPLLLFTVHDSGRLEKEALAAGVAAIVSKEYASDLVAIAVKLLNRNYTADTRRANVFYHP
jgi:two-component system, chemotaxis family, chemotaxis protein CheY